MKHTPPRGEASHQHQRAKMQARCPLPSTTNATSRRIASPNGFPNEFMHLKNCLALLARLRAVVIDATAMCARTLSAIPMAAAILVACANLAHADPWEYVNSTDKATGRASSFAIAQSTNSLKLPAPHAGTNYGQLTVRQHAQLGLAVLVQIQKGLIHCATPHACQVSIRFDNAPPVVFAGTPPQDGSTTAVFLNNPLTFIAQAQKAARIFVQLQMDQAPSQVLEFETTAPLVWQVAQPGKAGAAAGLGGGPVPPGVLVPKQPL